VVPFQIPSNHDLGHKMAPPGTYQFFIGKSHMSSSQKLLGQFQPDFTGMFFGWSFRFL